MTRKRLFQTGFLLSLYLFILTPPQEVYHGWDLVIGLGAIALFAALHLLLERPTWQLYPSYGTVPLLFILFFYPEGWFILLLRLVGTLGLTLSVLATIIVPVPHLPALPPGGFKVGTITECWMQRELVSEDWASQDKKKWQQRKLWAKIWYPADSDDPRYLTSPHAPYLLLKGEEIIPGTKLEDLIEANPAKKILGDASWIKSHIVHYTKCHARYGAPLSPHLAQWPVVVYEHGQHSAPEKNTAFCERLASRGYVVFAIYNDDADKAMPGPWNRRQRNLQHMLRRIGAISALPELSVGIKPPARRLLPFMQSASTPTIVERLGLNMFVDRLDVSRGVGLFGHSLGGTTTMMACCRGAQSLFNRPEAELEPERSEGEGEDATFDVPDIVCGVALDAWMRPVREALDAPDRQVVKPLLVINSDEWQSKPGDLAKQAGLVQRRSDDAVVYMMTAKGTSHENFTDFAWLFATRLPGRPILLPRSWMKEADSTDMLLLGSSSPHEVWYSWTSVVESFFDKHLLLPPEMSVESYGSMLLFDPLFTIKIYSNMEHQEMQQQEGHQEDEEEEEEGQARRLNTAGAGTGGHHG